MDIFKDLWFIDGKFYMIPSPIYFNQKLESEVEEEKEDWNE